VPGRWAAFATARGVADGRARGGGVQCNAPRASVQQQDCRWDGLCGWMIGGRGLRGRGRGGREGGRDARRKQGGWQAALASGRAAAVFFWLLQVLLLTDVSMC